MKVHDCYRILDVSPRASFDEVQSSYRRLVKRYHPDLTGRPTDGQRLARIVDAYRVLQESAGVRTGMRTQRHSGSGAGLSLSALGNLAVSGRTPGTRASAVRRLAQSGRRASYAWIRTALFDESPIVVAAAVDAVGKLRVLQSGGELAVVFAHSDAEGRLRVLDAVSRMRDMRPFRSVILSGMQDESLEARRQALRLFRRMKAC